MASLLKVDALTGVTTAGSISVTGEGNSTTTNLQQGLAKAWVNFNGTSTIAARDSFNHSSLTDNGTGDYTVNLTNSMNSADGFVATAFCRVSGNYGFAGGIQNTTLTASSFRLSSLQGTSFPTAADGLYVLVAIHGDLA